MNTPTLLHSKTHFAIMHCTMSFAAVTKMCCLLSRLHLCNEILPSWKGKKEVCCSWTWSLGHASEKHDAVTQDLPFRPWLTLLRVYKTCHSNDVWTLLSVYETCHSYNVVTLPSVQKTCHSCNACNLLSVHKTCHSHNVWHWSCWVSTRHAIHMTQFPCRRDTRLATHNM